MSALIALVDVATQRRRAAALNRGHDAVLRRGQVMPLTIGVAIAAEHIRHFRPRSGHGWALRRARVRRASLRSGSGWAAGRAGWVSRRPCW
jgi:hypothetical protein